MNFLTMLKTVLKTKAKQLTVLTFFALALTACGGGGSKDTTAPEKPSSTDKVTKSDGSITLTGTAEANSTITALFPDGSKKTTKADSSGNYLLTSLPLQPSGNIEITSTDDNGNISEPATVANIASKETIKAIYLSTGIMPQLTFEPS